MTTIEIDTPDGPIDALLNIPQGQGPWPGVVVIHDAFGYGPDKKATNERIAQAGYVALTPNMYARGGRVRCITRVMRELLTQRGRALDDILAARDHMQALPECSGRVGIAGLHGRPVCPRYVAQGFWCLRAVLRHSPAPQSQRDPRGGVPDRRQLRRPRPAGSGRPRQIPRSDRGQAANHRHQGLPWRRAQLREHPPRPTANPHRGFRVRPGRHRGRMEPRPRVLRRAPGSLTHQPRSRTEKCCASASADQIYPGMATRTRPLRGPLST